MPTSHDSFRGSLPDADVDRGAQIVLGRISVVLGHNRIMVIDDLTNGRTDSGRTADGRKS